MRGRLNDEERVALMLDSIDAIQQYTQEIISFEDLLWIPAVFLHYEAFNLEWTLLVANLMALVVFLSVGKRMGTREWASRALHRLAALFQACVVGLIYLLVLKGVVWCVYTLWLGRPEFYLEGSILSSIIHSTIWNSFNCVLHITENTLFLAINDSFC